MGKDKSSKRDKYRRSRSQRQQRRWLWAGGIFLLFVLSAVVVSRTVNPSRSSADSLDVAENLPNTDSAFNVGTRIGQAAPTFTLQDANGEPYKFQPGDGRKYVFAFNMGYV